MLEYWKDGKQVKCEEICGRGHIGQVVILDHVSYGENPDLEKYPLAKYVHPYAFTIVEKVEGKDGYYVVTDAEGNRITLRNRSYGADGSYLYDANEWLMWNKGYQKDKLTRKEHKIEQLKGNLDLLKDIIIKQGFRVVTEDQAKTLGIV